MSKKIFSLYYILLLIILLQPYTAYAADITGTRPLGMAGAFVGVSDDANSVFWNPAGMKQFSKNIIATNYNIDRLDHPPKGSFILVNSKKDELLDGGIGLSRNNAVILGREYEKTSFVVALADKYTKYFSIGVSGKYMQQEGHGVEYKKGVTLDSGAIISLGDRLTFGITGYNLTSPSIQSFKRKVRIGVRIRFFKILSISADGAREFADKSDGKKNYAIGGEVEIGSYIRIRGGFSEEKIYDNRYAAGGITFNLSSALIDYAYVYDLTEHNAERHMVGITYPF